MRYEKSVGGDEVARAISLFAEAGRQSLDWAAFWRAVAENRHEEVERRRDAAVVDAWLGKVATDDSQKAPVADAEALAIKIDSILLAGVVRFGKAWQRMIEDRAPVIRRVLEDYQASDDAAPREQLSVVIQAQILLQELGSLVRDQASLIQGDLRRFEEDLFPIGGVTDLSGRKP